MAINNTYTEQFDWFNMSPHHIEDNGTEQSIKVMNDYCTIDFDYDLETTGGAQVSGQGESNEAYKNWKNINLALGPICGFENPVIAGQVRQTTADSHEPDGTTSGGDDQETSVSWFQGVKSDKFATDGMIVMPYRGHQSDQADVKWRANRNAQNEGTWSNFYRGTQDHGVNGTSMSSVVQYHVPGGLAPNTWMPLLSWGMGNLPEQMPGLDPFNWTTQEDSINYWEKYASDAITGNNDAPARSPHQRIHGLRTAAHNDTVWDQYDVDSSKKWQTDDGAVTFSSKKRASNHATYYRGHAYPVGWWYAHDGQGNAMIVSLTHYWKSDHNAAGAVSNKNWGMGGENGKHGASQPQSGGFIHQAPQDLIDASSNHGIPQLQEWANNQRTSWLYKNSTDLLQHGWMQSTPMAYDGSHYGKVNAYTGGHKAEIIHGLTPFGSADDAALKTPQNLYLHRFGANHNFCLGRGYTSWKFGNLVKTNSLNAWYNGHGRGYNGQRSGTRYDNVHHYMNASPSTTLIAAQEVATGTGNTSGPVRINMFTTGGQTDPFPLSDADSRSKMFYEFPGAGQSYGAIDKQHSTPEHANGAWENAGALIDPGNPLDAIAKASGEDNAVYVPLVGMTEGNQPDDGDKVSTVSVTLGGTRKMVLGPQVLKVKLVDKDGNALTGTRTIPGEGSDVLNDDLTIVFPKSEVANVTYSIIREAKVKVWVHTP